MSSLAGYELIDFGDGRKLERFGDAVLDRPSPSAEHETPQFPKQWKTADARYNRRAPGRGRWNRQLSDDWRLRLCENVFELKTTEFGQVGVFPEQISNWEWIANKVQKAKRPLRVLNLFGYTGGSSLAAARHGADVVHVDAADNVVRWARRNADHSGLAAAPIRWIVEDAPKFVARELRRGSRYDGVILDPPSYGHGPKGQVWRIERDLPDLLALCGELTQERRAFLLLSCHSPGYGAAELEALLADTVFGSCQAGARGHNLWLETESGRRLHSGVVARWPA